MPVALPSCMCISPNPSCLTEPVHTTVRPGMAASLRRCLLAAVAQSDRRIACPQMVVEHRHQEA